MSTYEDGYFWGVSQERARQADVLAAGRGAFNLLSGLYDRMAADEKTAFARLEGLRFAFMPTEPVPPTADLPALDAEKLREWLATLQLSCGTDEADEHVLSRYEQWLLVALSNCLAVTEIVVFSDPAGKLYRIDDATTLSPEGVDMRGMVVLHLLAAMSDLVMVRARLHVVRHRLSLIKKK